jgi:hypothetical protein
MFIQTLQPVAKREMWTIQARHWAVTQCERCSPPDSGTQWNSSFRPPPNSTHRRNGMNDFAGSLVRYLSSIEKWYWSHLECGWNQCSVSSIKVLFWTDRLSSRVSVRAQWGRMETTLCLWINFYSNTKGLFTYKSCLHSHWIASIGKYRRHKVQARKNFSDTKHADVPLLICTWDRNDNAFTNGVCNSCRKSLTNLGSRDIHRFPRTVVLLSRNKKFETLLSFYLPRLFIPSSEKQFPFTIFNGWASRPWLGGGKGHRASPWLPHAWFIAHRSTAGDP